MYRMKQPVNQQDKAWDDALAFLNAYMHEDTVMVTSAYGERRLYMNRGWHDPFWSTVCNKVKELTVTEINGLRKSMGRR